ncbi:MAG: hypothetical protein M3N43_05260 [Actinomycetota bacterium]|nr:hypothetical protein [Actinomycetota bacterium]
MMIGRRYRAPINISTAFTTAIDVFELLAGSSVPLALMGFRLGQTTEIGDAQEEGLQLVLKQVTGAPTSGSGGGTSTARPVLPNDVAASATLETGNTTKLTGGTSVDLDRPVWNIRQDYPLTYVPEMYHVIAGGTRLVLEMVTVPNDSIGGIFGVIEFMELV